MRWLLVLAMFIDAVNSQSSGGSSGATCADTITDCNSYLDLCTNPSYTAVMYRNCAGTCKLCQPTQNGCLDNSASCTSWKNNGFCTSSSYTTQTKAQYCAKSCNLCNTTTSGVTCVDASTLCASWNANGFCTNGLYSDIQKKQSCSKTCGFCPPSGK